MAERYREIPIIPFGPLPCRELEPMDPIRIPIEEPVDPKRIDEPVKVPERIPA